MGVRRDAGHAFQSEVKGGQRKAGLVHEDDEEASKTGVHMQRQFVAHSQLEQQKPKTEISFNRSNLPLTVPVTV